MRILIFGYEPAKNHTGWASHVPAVQRDRWARIPSRSAGLQHNVSQRNQRGCVALCGEEG